MKKLGLILIFGTGLLIPAAPLWAVQQNAGPEYEFELVGGRAVARTPSQGFTAELADGALHEYGKSARPGRKLGHITVVADSADARDTLIQRISRSVT